LVLSPLVISKRKKSFPNSVGHLKNGYRAPFETIDPKPQDIDHQTLVRTYQTFRCLAAIQARVDYFIVMIRIRPKGDEKLRCPNL
jgi:hypothetical protein